MEKRPFPSTATNSEEGQSSKKKIHWDKKVQDNGCMEEMQCSGLTDEEMGTVSQDVGLPKDPTDDLFADNVLRMKIPIQNIEVDLDEGEKRSKDRIKSDFFLNVVSLRNSGGGVLIIENQNHGGIDESNDPLYKENFNDMVEDELQGMATQRGEMGNYEDWYQSEWWNGEGKWLIYYIKDGPQLTFPCKSKVFTATEHNIKAVRIDDIQRRLLQSLSRPSEYVPSVKHVHCNKKNGKLQLGERLVHLHESTNIQLKAFSNAGDKSISKICKDIRDYSSAFCQNEFGGSIYFGIEEEVNKLKQSSKISKRKSTSKTPSVCGIRFDIDDDKEQEIRRKIDHEICNMMLWMRHDGEKASPDEIQRYYEVRFHPVDPKNSSKKVMEVSVAKFYGCVFSSDPKPPYLDAKGEIKHFTTEEWIPMVIRGYQAEVLSRDKISLTQSFRQLDMGSKQVYEVEGSSEKIQQTIFKTEKGLFFTPEELLTQLNRQHGDFLKQFKDTLQRVFSEDMGVVVMENFASIVKEKSEYVSICPGNQICDFFVLTEKQMPIFISLVYFDAQQVDSVRSYNREMAKLIKVNLSKYCQSFVTILFGVVNINGDRPIEQQIERIISHKERHPDLLVQMNRRKLSEYLRCFTVMASVFPSPLHNRIGTSLLNIATEEQFDLIWNEPYRSRRLLIKGFPGTGKTIIAHRLIHKLSHKGAKQEEILFLTNHITSCDQARKMKCCVALTPEGLEKDIHDSTRKGLYQAIKYIIVDDTQLICANKNPGDNDWFLFLENLWKKKRNSSSDGIFWMFYGEHTYRISSTENMDFVLQHFEQERKLESIIRNSHEIASFAAKYSENREYKDAVKNIKSVHSFKGQPVVCKKVPLSNEMQCVQAVGNFLNEVLLEGYNLEDVAVLFSRKRDIPSTLLCISKERKCSLISHEKLERKTNDTCRTVELPEVGNVGICSGSDNDITGYVVVDTIRRYSGLDRPVVLAVNPFVAPNDHYTRLDDLYLIIATRPNAKLEVWENAE